MSRQAEINLHTDGGLQLGLVDTLSTEQIEFRMRAVSYNTAFQTRVGVQVEWVIGIGHGSVSYIYEWVKGDTHTQLCISDMNDYILNL